MPVLSERVVYSPDVPKPMGGALAENEPVVLEVDGVTLYVNERVVILGDHDSALSPRETKILAYLMARPHFAHPKSDLLDHIFGPTKPKSADVMFHTSICNIRTAIGEDRIETHFLGSYGWGYFFGDPRKKIPEGK